MPTQLAIPDDWNEAAQHAQAIPGMSEAVAYFRRALGERWLGWRQRSHLARSFHTRIQGNVPEWVRLHRLALVLSAVRNSKDSDRVVKELCDKLVQQLGSQQWGRHIAAEQTLEFCARLGAAGVRVGLIEPTNKPNTASPDAQVWFNDRPVTTEFKALHDPDEKARWDVFEDAFYGGLMARGAHALDGLFPLSIEFRAPALDHTLEILDAVAALFAARDLAWRELPKGSGRARFVAGPDPSQGWKTPISQRPDLARIVSNLRADWLRQPRAVDGPTVLVVLTQHLFPAPDADALDDARRSAAELRDALHKHSVPSAQAQRAECNPGP